MPRSVRFTEHQAAWLSLYLDTADAVTQACLDTAAESTDPDTRHAVKRKLNELMLRLHRLSTHPKELEPFDHFALAWAIKRNPVLLQPPSSKLQRHHARRTAVVLATKCRSLGARIEFADIPDPLWAP